MATDTSITTDRTAVWADKASDWLNPILVKETRQALKSRQFVATFFLMLVAAWLISVFGVVFAGPGLEHRPVGGGFFFAFYVVLAVAVFIVVPFGAFRSLLSERDLFTWEVLSITTLKPRQVVSGKLLSALVQLFVYYSAITPFIAFANLLKGIDVPTIAFILVASMLWSMALSMIALTLSTFGNHRYWQVLLTLSVLGGLLMELGMALSAAGAAVGGEIPFDQPEFWWITAAAVTYVLGYCALFLQIAIAQLTFDADNRSTGIRIIAAGIFWLTLVWISLMFLLSGKWGMPSPPSAGDIDELLVGLATVAAIHWTAIGLFAATEPDRLSRRVRRDVQKIKLSVIRVILAPFLPGGSRGLAYLVGHLGILWIVVTGIGVSLGSRSDQTVQFVTALCCYIVIYVGLGAAMGRAARALSGDFRPAHARVLTLLMVALGAILPNTLYLFDYRGLNLSPVYFVTDPFHTLYYIQTSNYEAGTVVLIVCAVAVVVLAINLKAMIVGLVDIARGTNIASPQQSQHPSMPVPVPSHPPTVSQPNNLLEPADLNG